MTCAQKRQTAMEKIRKADHKRIVHTPQSARREQSARIVNAAITKAGGWPKKRPSHMQGPARATRKTDGRAR